MSNAEDKAQQIAELEQIVKEAEARLAQAKAMLTQVAGAEQSYTSVGAGSEKVILGEFNGEYMIDDAKKQYPVPANYASKSKLIEGDRLKLTITPDGAFIYKQISPAPRRRAIASIVYKDNMYYAQVGDELYRLLTASVTYFRLAPGDQITILTSLTKKSEWAAIENVVSANTAPMLNGQETSENMSRMSYEDDDIVDTQDNLDDLKIQPW